MDFGAILAWADESPTLAGIVATVVGGAILAVITTGVLTVKGRKPSFRWIGHVAGQIWARRPTRVARQKTIVGAAKQNGWIDVSGGAKQPLDRLATTPDGSRERPMATEARGATAREPFAPGHGLEDLEVQVRASDQRLVVKYKNGLQIGVITPTRGRFVAMHIRNGEAGPFNSIQDAMKALWDLD